MEIINIIDIVDSQIIASVKNEKNLDLALKSDINIVFLLTGNLITTAEYIKRIQKYQKKVFLHIDFIDGLSNSKSAINYISKVWKPDGIITTRANLIKYAKELNLMVIQRLFLIDKNALNSGIETAYSCQPDAIEVLPGIVPSIIDDMTNLTDLPIIAGGLIRNKQDISNGLQSGALAMSSGNPKLWNLKF